jgi:hypothetical protein
MKYLVLKWDDIDKYVKGEVRDALLTTIQRIGDARVSEGKSRWNSYYVVNTDDHRTAPSVKKAFDDEGYEPFDWNTAPVGSLRLWYRAHSYGNTRSSRSVFVPVESVDHAMAVVLSMKDTIKDDPLVYSFGYGLSENQGGYPDNVWTPWRDPETNKPFSELIDVDAERGDR